MNYLAAFPDKELTREQKLMNEYFEHPEYGWVHLLIATSTNREEAEKMAKEYTKANGFRYVVVELRQKLERSLI